MLPIAKSVVLCQITAPISSGAFASISSLLPAGAIAAIGDKTVVSVRVKAIDTAIDVRSIEAIAGEQIATGTREEYPAFTAGFLLVRSSGAAATCSVAIALL